MFPCYLMKLKENKSQNRNCIVNNNFFLCARNHVTMIKGITYNKARFTGSCGQKMAGGAGSLSSSSLLFN